MRFKGTPALAGILLYLLSILGLQIPAQNRTPMQRLRWNIITSAAIRIEDTDANLLKRSLLGPRKDEMGQDLLNGKLNHLSLLHFNPLCLRLCKRRSRGFYRLRSFRRLGGCRRLSSFQRLGSCRWLGSVWRLAGEETKRQGHVLLLIFSLSLTLPLLVVGDQRWLDVARGLPSVPFGSPTLPSLRTEMSERMSNYGYRDTAAWHLPKAHKFGLKRRTTRKRVVPTTHPMRRLSAAVESRWSRMASTL